RSGNRYPAGRSPKHLYAFLSVGGPKPQGDQGQWSGAFDCPKSLQLNPLPVASREPSQFGHHRDFGFLEAVNPLLRMPGARRRVPDANSLLWRRTCTLQKRNCTLQNHHRMLRMYDCMLQIRDCTLQMHDYKLRMPTASS